MCIIILFTCRLGFAMPLFSEVLQHLPWNLFRRIDGLIRFGAAAGSELQVCSVVSLRWQIM